jgi:hypothetical protein
MEREIEKAIKDFEMYEGGVERLWTLRKELNSLNTKGFEEDAERIRKKLKSVHLIPEIEKDILELKAKISGIDIDFEKLKIDRVQDGRIRAIEEKEKRLENKEEEIEKALRRIKKFGLEREESNKKKVWQRKSEVNGKIIGKTTGEMETYKTPEEIARLRAIGQQLKQRETKKAGLKANYSGSKSSNYFNIPKLPEGPKISDLDIFKEFALVKKDFIKNKKQEIQLEKPEKKIEKLEKAEKKEETEKESEKKAERELVFPTFPEMKSNQKIVEIKEEVKKEKPKTLDEKEKNLEEKPERPEKLEKMEKQEISKISKKTRKVFFEQDKFKKIVEDIYNIQVILAGKSAEISRSIIESRHINDKNVNKSLENTEKIKEDIAKINYNVLIKV